MAFPVQELLTRFKDLVVSQNNHSVEFTRIDDVKECTKNSLIFVDDSSQIPSLNPAVMVTSKDVADALPEVSYCVVVVGNVRLAQAKIKQYYQDYDCFDAEWGEVHESAVIHPSVQLGAGVRLGPNVVLGKNVVVGKGTQIRSGTVIEHDARLGDYCVINSLVNIGYNCIVGNRANIHSGVVIGNEGFGFAQDNERNYHRIPHTGRVEIGDDVQIGSNCNIDRGTYQSTIIGNGVKLDSLCHIAHNVHIDDGSLFASQACIAGSTYIGKRVMASGQVGILDHLTVADNAVLVHRTGVTESIAESGMYAGVPAKPFKEYVRNLGATKRIDRLNQQIKELKQKLLD